MGAEESVPLPPPPPATNPDQPTPYFMFSLLYNNIHMVYAPLSVVNIFVKTTTQALADMGYEAIDYHKPKLDHGYKIVLHESLFSIGTSADTSARAKYLMATLLQKLGQAGWIPVVSSDLRRMGDCANVLMQYAPERRLADDNSSNILVVGISAWDKLRIFTQHQSIVDAVKEAIAPHLSIQDMGADNPAGIAQTKIKLHGSPWGYVSAEESISARAAIARIIQNLSKLNLRLLINFNTKPSADTYFFTVGADPDVVDTPGCGLITLGLNSNDQLRVIVQKKDGYFSGVVDAMRKVINKHWHRGLQDEWEERRGHTFKFKGNPWWTDGAETVETRVVICKVLEAMFVLGWRLTCATDISRKPQDKTTFIFKHVRHSQSVVIPCLSFNESNKIRAINMPGDCVTALGQLIGRIWAITRTQSYGRSVEWKLDGMPWDFSNYCGKALALHMLSIMNCYHYALYTSADVSSKYVHRKNAPDYPLDVHSWFFIPVSALMPPTPQAPAAAAPEAAAASGDDTLSLRNYWNPETPYSSNSRAPSPYQSHAASPAASPCNSSTSTPSRGTPLPPSAPPQPPTNGFPSAPYYYPGHSDFEPLPGGPVPEINLEMADDTASGSTASAHEETPPPSYDEFLRNYRT